MASLAAPQLHRAHQNRYQDASPPPRLAKNATRSFVALGLANIYLARQRLMA